MARSVKLLKLIYIDMMPEQANTIMLLPMLSKIHILYLNKPLHNKLSIQQ
ncbi:hypothetical protein [Piscirickettsia salmonis]|nr:hypothetical protein [Piscirickettsia salmonis]